MGDYIAYERGMKDGDLHPIIKGMNVLGFECSTLGNHEFNYGLDFMDKVIAGANFPLVCANLAKGALAASAREDDLYLKPYIILDRTVTDGAGAEHPIKVGIDRLRAAPDHDVGCHASGRQGDDARHRRRRARLGARDARGGADIVIALSHSGIDATTASERMENASLHLAGVEGVDAVVTGHQHLVFPGAEDFEGLNGVDAREGNAHGQARRHGRLLGLAYGPRRPAPGTGRRQVAHSVFHHRGAADL